MYTIVMLLTITIIRDITGGCDYCDMAIKRALAENSSN